MTTIIAIQGDGFSAVCVDSRISDIDNSGYISQVFTLKEGNCKVAWYDSRNTQNLGMSD